MKREQNRKGTEKRKEEKGEEKRREEETCWVSLALVMNSLGRFNEPIRNQEF